jgi:hypothetical protein
LREEYCFGHCLRQGPGAVKERAPALYSGGTHTSRGWRNPQHRSQRPSGLLRPLSISGGLATNWEPPSGAQLSLHVG